MKNTCKKNGAVKNYLHVFKHVYSDTYLINIRGCQKGNKSFVCAIFSNTQA